MPLADWQIRILSSDPPDWGRRQMVETWEIASGGSAGHLDIDYEPYVPLISPFIESARQYGLSFGVSHAGYDVRLGGKILRPVRGQAEHLQVGCLSPETLARFYQEEQYSPGNTIYLHAGEYVLAQSVETLAFPAKLLGRVLGKSTLARMGLLVNCTVLEPGWTGQLTMGLKNLSPYTINLVAGMGIAQIVFEVLAARPSVTYASKNNGQPGKYQGEAGATPAKGG